MDDSKGQPLPSVGLAVNDKGNINTIFPYGKPQIAQKQRSKSMYLQLKKLAAAAQLATTNWTAIIINHRVEGQVAQRSLRSITNKLLRNIYNMIIRKPVYMHAGRLKYSLGNRKTCKV